MAAYRRNATDRSFSLYLNNEKSQTMQMDDNRVSVIAVNIIHVANIDIRLEIVKKWSQ